MKRFEKRLLLGLVLVASCLLASNCVSVVPVPTSLPAETPSPSASTSSSILSSISAIDAHTVQFTLTRPDPAFLQKLAFPAFGPQSPANIEQYGGGGDLIRNPVGTGPFRLVEWVPGDHITLARNDDYWGPRPAIETLTYRVVPDSTARFLELQAGAVDGIDNLAPDDIPAAEADPRIQVHTRPPFNIGFLGINRAHQPFDDARVRRAVALAINRQEIVAALFPPTAQTASQFVPPSIFGHTHDLEDYPHDLGQARELLAQAGYPNGFDTTLWVMGISRPYFPYPDRVGEAIQADLAAVGIQAEIITYDWGTYLEKVFAGEADLFLNGWMADFPDATNFLDTFFTGSDDSLGPAFPELVTLIQDAGSILDPADRQTLYDQANQMIHDLVPAVPIVHNRTAIAFRDDVQGIQASPFSQELFYPVSVPGRTDLVFARSGDSVGLDPVDESDYESLMVCAQIMEPLVAFEPGTTNVVPWLAEKWEVSDDLLTWTFTLRQDVTFHDGEDLDAEAVVFNFERWWDRDNPYHVGHTGSFVHWTYYFGGFKGE
jgi:peptide/nickel transport system substrate-binding protein